MKEYEIENIKIIKAFDHTMYKVVLDKGNGSGETYTQNILARNVTTLVEMIEKFGVHGQKAGYIKSIESLGVCSDVYVGDLYKYSR